MNKEKILEKLKDISYPKLDKNIVELKTVDLIEADKKSLKITLCVLNKEAFEEIQKNIKNLFKDDFKNIEIKTKIQNSKKSVNYGTTFNPNNKAPYAKKVIAVTSGKGGVGKSTVSANISVALAQKGYKVGLLDADVYGPNIPRMFNVQNEKLRWNEKDKIVPSENFGIKLMSVALTTPSEDTPLVWRSSVAISALIQFLEDVDWGELDFLVIDMPPGTGDVQLTMAQELPISTAVLVTTPQNVACDDVSRAIMMFKETKVPIGGIIENMSYFVAPDTKKVYHIFGKGGAEILSQKYGIKILGKIPLSIQIRELCDEGKPPVALANEDIKKLYQEITGELLKKIKNIS